ncbi:hypothetical protein BST86_03690 [Nonlabens agnitus]|uniref:TonB-dependent receptor plug domain-containing protein n=1 Tax=Nonlabens agnitus TaxID=870484 RepID=A0A2S9WXT4_9FLAO|nr:hypothetical protein BST86_03690 [Nonlabens agnitus]
MTLSSLDLENTTTYESVTLGDFYLVSQDVIKGKVTTADGPLLGVTVVNLTTNKGTATDIDGNYEITASVGDQIQFSYQGYATQTITIANDDRLDVLMEVSENVLDQIVIIGYGESSRRKVTTSISSIDEEQIEDKPFTSAEQALVGTVPGVSVIQSSGSPGGGVSVRIRGANSISAGVEPLYIIDGVQVLNTQGLNPSDIKSVDVLKDASALAIYGSRASNGVVLITTKRGSSNRSVFNFSSYVGEDQVINTLPVLNSQQYIDYLNISLANAGLDPVTDPFGFQNNTDWQRELYDPAFIQNYQLAFSGGSENSNYYLSGGYRNQEGVIDPSEFERYSLRFNGDFDLTDKFKVGTSIALTRTESSAISDNARVNQGGVVLSALQTPPTIPVQNADGTYPLNPYQALENPIALVRGQNLESLTYKIISNVYGEYDLIDNLKLKSSFSVDLNAAKVDNFIDPFTTGNGRALGGQATNQNFDELVWTWDNTIDYNLDVNQDLNLGFLLGTTAQESKFESSFLVGQGFTNASVQTAEAASEAVDVGASESAWANISYFTRLTADYKDKYLLNATLRRDGSSRFGVNNRYATYYAASAAWLMSEETFLDDYDWIDLVKLRYGYGTLGNQLIGDFNSFGLYSPGANYPINGQIAPAFFPSQIENRDLTWESTEGHNIGLDLTLLDRRLSFTAEAYYKRTYDLLLNREIPTTSGFSNSLQNIGEMVNKGLEFSGTAVPIQTDDFNWTLNANISINSNEVIDIGGSPIFGGGVPDQGNVAIIREGEPIGNFFGYVAEGIDPNTGNVIFSDIDGNGIVNESDRTILGNALPDYTYGLSNTFSYKGLELFVFFQGNEGQDIYNASRFELENQSSFKNQLTTTLDRWTPQNRDGSLPIAVFGDPAQNGRASSRWVEDGSFIKLREITLSYNLPDSVLDYLNVSSFKVYMQGRNLYTWTGYSGYDPEVSRDGGSTISSNIDFGTYPQVKSVLFGANLNF